MSYKKYASLSLLSFSIVLLFLLSACQVSPTGASQSLLPLTSSVSSTALNAQTVTTSCPASGMGRAAVLPSLPLGKHQNLIYTSNQYSSKDLPLSGTLIRYDVVTKATTNILKVTHQNINGAQVSANGQWVLFETETNSGSKLELIRMDGRYQQTLYCATSSGIYQAQWSTDQKLIVFTINNSGTQYVNLLNTKTGVVQTELSLPLNSQSNGVLVRTWLDTTHIYLTNTQQDQPPNIIYLLDTSKGPNQQLSDLTTVFQGNFQDFDSSYTGTQLFINACTCGQGGFSGPGSITVQPATGGQSQTIYSTPNYAITSVRAITPTTLLFTIDNFSPIGQSDQSQNGLWSIQTNGAGLTRLTTDTSGQGSSLNAFSQFPWSNVSRNGKLYSVQVNGNSEQHISISSLSGGTPTTVTSVTGNGTSLFVDGWTKM